MALRVLFDMRVAGYRSGGIGRYARELHAALARLPDLDVLPLYARADRAAEPRATRLRTPPHHRWETWTIAVDLLLARARGDIFHATDFIAPRLPRVPVIATVHDLAFRHWPEDLTPDARAWYGQLAASRRWTSGWIVPSRWAAEDLATLYDIDPATIAVVPHGVSLDLLALAPLPRDRRGTYVLAVGTVEPRKQYDLLLDAWRHDPSLPRLIVAGASGWNSGATEQRLATTPHVTWLQSAGDADIRRLYREAIALVVPSRAEGFGLPALEAMACGTPVVSSGGGALPEVTGDSDERVGHPSADAWATAIARVSHDAEHWQGLASAGRARAATFSWESAARATADVYRRVAGD